MPSPRSRHFAYTSDGVLRFYDVAELENLPPPSWLVESLLPENAFAVLYGPSGAGKSFLALDIALHIATGLPWNGKMTSPGYVLYVSAEGRAGLGQRLKAWRLDKGLDAEDFTGHIALVPEAVSVHGESDHIEKLFTRFEEVEEEPRLIVFDTLARCFDGDENKQEDMGRFVKGVDRFRGRYGCAVLAVHHTGKNGMEERGSGALRAASDTMIHLMPGVLGMKGASPFIRAKETTFTMQVSKQKDAPEADIAIGRLRPVAGTTSCVPSIEWISEAELLGQD
jgi:RecA-family ATPase